MSVTTTTAQPVTTTATLPVTSTTAPVTTAVTAQNPVDIAGNKLSKTAIDNLWTDKVTNASNVFTKFAGLISYLWNRSTAASQDTPEVKATIEAYNTASLKLVKAIANRALTERESASMGVAPMQFNSGAVQLSNAAQKQAADVAEKEFYDVFKKRCTQLNISTNSADFGVYTQAALNNVTRISESKEFLSDLPSQLKDAANLIPVKMGTMVEGFSKRIYVDMVDGFASQPAASITIDGFKQKAADMKGFFPNNSSVDIEASLRQALKANNDQAFNALANEFLNVDPTNAKVAELKGQLRTQFEAEKQAIETELSALRGPSGWDGTINAAFQRMDAARVARDAARAELFNVLGIVNPTMADDQLAALLNGNFSTDITAKRDLWLQKVAEFNTAKQEHDALVARFAELAQYQPGTQNVIGGKLAQVNANLQDAQLGAAARAEATKIGNFYRELHTDVNERNKQARFNRMHTIIGN